MTGADGPLIPGVLTHPFEWHGPDLPHVLLVVDQFPKALGGGERTVLRLAGLLPQYGFRASVLTLSMHPESSVLAAALPFPVYLLPLTRTYDRTAWRAARLLGRFLREQQVAIVQTFFESSDLWAGSVTKALSDAKLIWSRRDMGILRSAKHQVAYRLLAGVPDQIFAVSDRVREHCVKVDGVNSARVSTIYNGVDIGACASLKKGRESFHVATVGNIRRVKGHDLLIQAAPLVLRQCPKTNFSIAGEVLEPGYYEQLQEMVRTLGIADHFHFSGGISDIQKHLEEADLFVLPSRSEGFSNAILEAMACSLPVVATDVGGNAEAVSNGVNGYVIPAEDAGLLAARIIQLAANPDEAQRMGAAGRQLAEEKFSTHAMMERVAAAYRMLLTS